MEFVWNHGTPLLPPATAFLKRKKSSVSDESGGLVRPPITDIHCFGARASFKYSNEVRQCIWFILSIVKVCWLVYSFTHFWTSLCRCYWILLSDGFLNASRLRDARDAKCLWWFSGCRPSQCRNQTSEGTVWHAPQAARMTPEVLTTTIRGSRPPKT